MAEPEKLRNQLKNMLIYACRKGTNRNANSENMRDEEPNSIREKKKKNPIIVTGTDSHHLLRTDYLNNSDQMKNRRDEDRFDDASGFMKSGTIVRTQVGYGKRYERKYKFNQKEGLP